MPTLAFYRFICVWTKIMVDKYILMVLNGHVILKRRSIYILFTRVLQPREYLLVVFTVGSIFGAQGGNNQMNLFSS